MKFKARNIGYFSVSGQRECPCTTGWKRMEQIVQCQVGTICECLTFGAWGNRRKEACSSHTRTRQLEPERSHQTEGTILVWSPVRNMILWAPPGVMPGHRGRSQPWALPGVPSPNHKETNAICYSFFGLFGEAGNGLVSKKSPDEW